MTLRKHWYLGFLALIGIYKLPIILAALQGDTSAFGLVNLLWFLWLFYLVPADDSQETR